MSKGFEAVGIGAATGCCAGSAVGGAVGTGYFPVVATSFGAWYGLALGLLVGLTDGLVLMLVRAATAARWALRSASALVWTLAAGAAIVGHGWLAQHPGGRLAVLVAAGLFGASVGPLIGRSDDPAATRRAVGRLTGRLLA